MARRLSGICAFAAALVVSACTPPDAAPPDAAPPAETVETESPTPIHNFGRRGEAGDFDAICRYDVLELPPVMALADFTIEHGGFTCHPAQDPILFVPQRDGLCPGSEQLALSPPETLSLEQASRAFYACMAMIQPGAEGSTDVVTFRSTSSPGEIDREFLSFVYNLMGLTNNDALPVDHLSHANNVACLETSQPSVVLERVVASDIADPSVYVAETHRGVCREVGARMTGHPWPAIGSGRDGARQF